MRRPGGDAARPAPATAGRGRAHEPRLVQTFQRYQDPPRVARGSTVGAPRSDGSCTQPRLCVLPGTDGQGCCSFQLVSSSLSEPMPQAVRGFLKVAAHVTTTCNRGKNEKRRRRKACDQFRFFGRGNPSHSVSPLGQSRDPFNKNQCVLNGSRDHGNGPRDHDIGRITATLRRVIHSICRTLRRRQRHYCLGADCR